VGHCGPNDDFWGVLSACECFDGQGVAFEAEAADDAAAGACEERVVTVVLAGEDVADVHLDGGCCDGGKGVVQGHAGVTVSTGVDDDAVGRKAGLLYAVDELAFDVALEIAYLNVGEAVAQLFYIVGDARGAVGFGLAYAGEVEVWSVDDFYMFHCAISLGWSMV